MKDKTKDRVVEIIARTMEIKPSSIELSNNLTGDLGLESLDLVDLVVAFEEEFGVEIPDQEIKQIQTVGDIVEYAKKHKK